MPHSGGRQVHTRRRRPHPRTTTAQDSGSGHPAGAETPEPQE
ncbi:hypothetical protein SLNWT_3117 [Streptomyces albus]|uniref:Uncharacterized protein n=1 Tax=Streptomyces albus (strain ATCC 21838 / DSM 41398 / FERM P-419 / JCM 4703 / NBRC 107858) TaxID=1081613 RepID=A0A0B5EM21_STRA4|nr:hypothetical protein SLNWT_3117 [Streptomyces albus]AOU77801.1 hypothetical protein SLNHY_3110 [Streptomyces albus]AYN33562.1 hypothetical protein DUI70_3061 [Streptomyces albus]